MNSAFDLTDKVVFITGAGRGIGRGIAEVLAEAGANVAMNALTSTNVDKTAAAIAEATGRSIVPVTGDVTNTAGATRVVDEVMERFGRIDILVNNLGDAIGMPLAALPDKENSQAIGDVDLQKIIDINMTGTVLCTRAVAPQMLERRSGKIVNISSYTAGRAGGNVVIYSMAKAAVVGFTRAQALEWASYGINVNAIAPGLYPEPNAISGERREQLAKWAKRAIPLGRTGELREVGYLALYLASPASDYMTGQTLYLDGGLSL
ncbi:MAG: SDR family oxidoreductase [Pseudomonadales bacterium]|nr:SDR family oxidoreductase [Pseudomonadales bacterium]